MKTKITKIMKSFAYLADIVVSCLYFFIFYFLWCYFYKNNQHSTTLNVDWLHAVYVLLCRNVFACV